MHPRGSLTPEPDSGPELGDSLDEIVVTIPCYEPANLRVQLSGRALCSHTLGLGMTGSGKSSILRWLVKGLIAHQADVPDQRSGLFVFDLNGDDTVGLIKKWAQESGRNDDVRLLTPETGYLDLFANLRSFEDLAAMTAQFMQGDWAKDVDNAYWNETTRMLIDAALSICLVVTGKVEANTAIRFMTNWVIAGKATAEDQALLDQFERMCAEAPKHLHKHTLGKIEFVRSIIAMWAKQLDDKTKGILVSCLSNALSGFLSLETRKYLDAERGACFNPEELAEGRIMVFSLPAGRYLESASILGRLIKARLFTALQERPQNRHQRLCAVIADEYHYLASGGVDRSSDVTALATLRSRNVAIIAATQSLDHLASVMGPHDFRSLVPNFGNHFFFRSTEATTGAFATAMMGMRQCPEPSPEETGNLLVGLPPALAVEYVCPPGALAQLEPCQAYVSLSTGYRSPGMIWLGGNHETPGPPTPVKPPTAVASEAESLSALRAAVSEKGAAATPPPLTPAEDARLHGNKDTGPTVYYGLTAWRRLLKESRFRKSAYASFDAFRQALLSLGHQPSGLTSLPICWWEAIVTLTADFGKEHPMNLIGVHQTEGRLLVTLSGDAVPPETYLAWIERLEKSLYPIRTRPLKRRDQRMLAVEAINHIFGPVPDKTDTKGE